MKHGIRWENLSFGNIKDFNAVNKYKNTPQNTQKKKKSVWQFFQIFET